MEQVQLRPRRQQHSNVRRCYTNSAMADEGRKGCLRINQNYVLSQEL
jgi:hypothetical protein